MIHFFKKNRGCLSIFGVFAFFVLLFPEIDLFFSGLFVNEKGQFFLSREPVVRFFYHSISFSLILFFLFVGWINLKKPSGFFLNRKKVLFLILVLAIGPGLIVNLILKESVGRARPRNIIEFGGEKTFSRPFICTNQCDRNCSFPSGHAAVGFFFVSVSFIFSRYRKALLFGGMAYGILVAAGRIIQGGHFFSDVVTSFFIVYVTARILWGIMGEDEGDAST